MVEVARGGAVYVIEADASLRSALATLFEAEGFEVRACGTVDELMRVWMGTPGACALLDCSTARHWRPAARNWLREAAGTLPIVAVTSDDDVGTRRIARSIGAQVCFGKPVDAAALLDAVRWALQVEGAAPPH